MRIYSKMFLFCGLSLLAALPALAEEIGRVSTTFKFVGANDKIVIEAFDDPDIAGVTGAIGVAEDTSDASISCHQTGPITLPEQIASGRDDGREVFKKSASLLFKKVQVVRFYDKKRSTLVYLTYSDRIIEGSPKNSISAIVLPQAVQGGVPAMQRN
jgi:CreA protein